MSKFIGFTFLLLILWAQPSFAQTVSKKVAQQELISLRFYHKLIFNDRWSLHGEVENRRFVFPDRIHQWVMPRVYVYYKTKHETDFGVAGTYFLQALPQNQSPVALLRPEFRVQQEVILPQNFGRWRLSHRYVVEERFIHNTRGNELDRGWNFQMRFRYRLQFQVPLTSGDFQVPVQLKLYDEILLNAGKQILFNVFDQNRIYGGFGFTLSDKWTMDLGYLHWYQQQPSGQNFYERHILRFQITHSTKI